MTVGIDLGTTNSLIACYLGADVRDAVVTVPAHFTDAQRLSTREAARLAGLQVRLLVNEPTASRESVCAAPSRSSALERFRSVVLQALEDSDPDVRRRGLSCFARMRGGKVG